jgi:hypothetical protein
LLATLTPAGARGPDSWRVLSTLRLAAAVAAPELDASVASACIGNEPTQLLSTTFEPLVQAVGANLKDRSSVAVFRSRLLCSALHAHYTDTRAAAREHSRRQRRDVVTVV